MGRIVEENSRDGLYREPLHPYTRTLLKAVPEISITPKKLESVRGGGAVARESAGRMPFSSAV
jgi:oligopeptide/dipeptide ABC transporter ATP-binding protein